MWDAGAGDVEHAFEVCVDEFIPVFVCHFGGGRDGGVYPCTVEDVGYAGVFGDYGVDESVAGGGRGDIERGGEVRAWVAETECFGERSGVDV